MSFVNIGIDGPPNHTLEVDGNMFISNVEQGTATNYVPVEVKGNLRIRNKPATGIDEYRVTDMQLIYPPLFGITEPSLDASGSITDFCIDSSGNVGIGVIPTEKLDVSGSLYATGSLTNESNLITATLSSSDTLTCNAIFHGVTSNIYGLLPTGAILMTTLTSTPDGWTDITSQFTDKNVLLAENQSTLTTGGNDTKNIAPIQHSHATLSHSATHTHTCSTHVTSSEGDHTHTTNFGTTTTSGVGGNHDHTIEDLTVSRNERWGIINNAWQYPQVNIMAASTSKETFTTSDGSHSHDGQDEIGSTNDGDNAEHSHSLNDAYQFNSSNNKGADHNHVIQGAGDNNPVNIVPAYYTLRFIKKN